MVFQIIFIDHKQVCLIFESLCRIQDFLGEIVLLAKEYTFYHFFKLGKNYEKVNEYIFITFSKLLKLTEKVKLLSTLLSLFWTLKNYEKAKPWSSLLSPFQTL